MRWLAAALILVAAIGRKDRRVAIGAVSLAGAGALYVAGDNAQRILFGGASQARWVYVAAGLIAAAISLRHLLRPTKHFDPVRLVAVQLAIGLVAYWLYYQLSGLALDPSIYQQESVLRTAGIELALIALAFGGVGLGIMRAWRPGLVRLGWSRLEGWQVALAVTVAFVLGLTNIPLSVLMYLLMPESEHAIAQIFDHVFAGVPVWSLPVIAILAGVGEETMFRGALQPRFGILATAALFALIHVQYGATLITLWVFVHALVYGLIRRHINTTTAVLAHATYDFSAFIHGPGFVAFCLIGVVAIVYLWRLVSRDPERLWRILKQGFIDDWRGLRQRSYLSPRWTSPPSSTD